MESSTSPHHGVPNSLPRLASRCFRFPSNQEKRQSYVRCTSALPCSKFALNNRAVSSKRISRGRIELHGGEPSTMASLLNENDKNQSDRRIKPIPQKNKLRTNFLPPFPFSQRRGSSGHRHVHGDAGAKRCCAVWECISPRRQSARRA